MLSQIDELLTRPIPEKLWHYTTLAGFQGIVTSKRIYASEIHYLNDREELSHALMVANEIIQETPETESNKFPARQFLKEAIHQAFETFPLHPSVLRVFVACFSASADQLSQWRGYSGDSSGVSLGFNLNSFRQFRSGEAMVLFAPCVYDPSTKKALLQESIRHYMSAVKGVWNTYYALGTQHPGMSLDEALRGEQGKDFPSKEDSDKQVSEARKNTFFDLMRVAALLKNKSFEEEQEWRLVLFIPAEFEKLQNPIRFRVGRASLIPYVAHPFSIDPNAGLPLTDLILGPGSDVNSLEAAQAFLKSEGTTIAARHSSVPYKPW